MALEVLEEDRSWVFEGSWDSPLARFDYWVFSLCSLLGSDGVVDWALAESLGWRWALVCSVGESTWIIENLNFYN